MKNNNLSKFECGVVGYVLSALINALLIVYILNNVNKTHKKQIKELEKPQKELIIEELEQLIKSLK